MKRFSFYEKKAPTWLMVKDKIALKRFKKA
ncbi:hypothetical protein W817_12440 [Escherichia coli RS218]|nr:hypothetical protein W817_12440 [Escherichia coli RS218]